MGKSFHIEPPRPRDAGRELPLHWEEGPMIVPGLFLLGFSALFGMFPIMALTGWPAGRPWCEPWMLIFFAPPSYAVSLGVLAMGLNFLVHRMQILVDGDTVWVRSRSLRGRNDWLEPIGAYRGVLRSEVFYGGDSDVTRHKAILKHWHADSRDVELFNTYTPEGHREAANCFARLLDLPLLLPNPDGSLREVAVHDLDKTDAELIGAGKLDARFDASMLRSSGRLELGREGDRVLLRSRPMGVEVLFGLAFGSTGLVAGAVAATQAGETSGVVAGILMILLFTVPGYAIAAHAAFSREHVVVDAEQVRVSKLLFERERRSESIPLRSIETVEVAKTARGKPCVRIRGDGRRIECGTYLRAEQRDALRRCVLARLGA